MDETGQKLSNLQSFLDSATAERYFDVAGAVVAGQSTLTRLAPSRVNRGLGQNLLRQALRQITQIKAGGREALSWTTS